MSKDEIKQKVLDVLKDDPDGMLRIIFYLDTEDKAYFDSDQQPPVYSTLKMVNYNESKHQFTEKEGNDIYMYYCT